MYNQYRPKYSVGFEAGIANGMLHLCLCGKIPVHSNFFRRRIVPESFVICVKSRGCDDAFNPCSLACLNNGLGLLSLQSWHGESIQENRLAALGCLKDHIEI